MKVTRTTRTIEFTVEESSVTICRRRTVIERDDEPGDASGPLVTANGHAVDEVWPSNDDQVATDDENKVFCFPYINGTETHADEVAEIVKNIEKV